MAFTYSTDDWADFLGSGVEFFSVLDELNAPFGKHYFVNISANAAGDTYATGGIAARAKWAGLSKVRLAKVSGNWGYGYEYVESSDKIKIFDGATELESGTTLNGLKLLLEIYGM